jgi:type IV secretory pathway VirJ component
MVSDSSADRIRIVMQTRRTVRTLEASDACAYPAGNLEELSRAIQLHQKLPEYKTPILVGYSSGATLVYAAIAAAPHDTFAGAISLGFCPDLEIIRPPCQQHGLTVTPRAKGVGFDLAPNHQMQTPWIVLQGDMDQVCAPATTAAFVAAIPAARLFSLPDVGHGFAVPRNWEPEFVQAYKAITTRPPSPTGAASAPEVGDLPLTEVPVRSSGRTETMAVILTGDGGWADLDRSVAAGLASRGIPSVGWSSLRYYWTPRTPDGAAADLARIIRHYAATWGATQVILIGYSFGADVLPFLVNRLPADMAGHVRQVGLLGLSPTAQFAFRFSSWFGSGTPSPYRTAPEVAHLNLPVLCVQGADETDSACRALRGAHITSVEIGRGHHFGGDYARIVDVILAHSDDPVITRPETAPTRA